MKILITGGAGFVGSHLTDALVAAGHDVTVFDCLDPQVHPEGGPPSWLNPGARFVRGDVRDAQALKGPLLEAEAVYHFAAAVGVGQSQYEIARYTDVNIGGMANLLDILANHKHRVAKLVVAGSMSAYGEGLYRCGACGPGAEPAPRVAGDMEKGSWDPRCAVCGGTLSPLPTPESKPLTRSSVYAIAKRAQEDLALCFGETYGLPVVSLRYFNIYGPRQSLSNPYTGVAAIFTSRIRNGQPPFIYEDGQQRRDFVSVHDVTRANLLALERSEADGRAVNIASGLSVSVLEIARSVAAALDSSIEPVVGGTFRKGDVRHCFADITAARETLGYRPQTEFAAGVRELAEWSASAECADRFDRMQEELRARGLA